MCFRVFYPLKIGHTKKCIFLKIGHFISLTTKTLIIYTLRFAKKSVMGLHFNQNWGYIFRRSISLIMRSILSMFSSACL